MLEAIFKQFQIVMENRNSENIKPEIIVRNIKCVKNSDKLKSLLILNIVHNFHETSNIRSKTTSYIRKLNPYQNALFYHY